MEKSIPIDCRAVSKAEYESIFLSCACKSSRLHPNEIATIPNGGGKIPSTVFHPKTLPPLHYKPLAPPQCVQVSDGWLVGFNQGEFGGVLCWYNDSGDHYYYIAPVNPIDLKVQGDCAYLIEGLDHLGLSYGSVARLKHSSQGRWSMDLTLALPSVPVTSCSTSAGNLIVVTSDGNVHRICLDTLLIESTYPIGAIVYEFDGELELAFPLSCCTLGTDESDLYIGAL